MKRSSLLAIPMLTLVAACQPQEGTDTSTEEADAPAPEGDAALIASALSAGPPDVTDGAMVIDDEGNVLREGDNGWTCIPETATMGAMCNDVVWMEALAAMQAGERIPTGRFGMSYMLNGEGDAPGVSNLDPTATEPTEDNMWTRDGPHVMIILPDPSVYADMSNDISEPVYVMWKDTPVAHLMVQIEKEAVE